MSAMLKLVHVTKETISKRNMDAYVDNTNLYTASEEKDVHDNNSFAALGEDLEEEEEIRGEQGDDPQKQPKYLRRMHKAGYY